MKKLKALGLAACFCALAFLPCRAMVTDGMFAVDTGVTCELQPAVTTLVSSVAADSGNSTFTGPSTTWSPSRLLKNPLVSRFAT